MMEMRTPRLVRQPIIPLVGLYWCCCCVLIGQAGSQSIPRQNVTWPTRQYPGMSPNPNAQHFFNLMQTMKGQWSFPHEASFVNASQVYNMRKMATPLGIAYVETVEDVQKVMVFAKKWDLMVSIRSSGHSYIGRSAHDGSVVINLLKMKGIQFNLTSQRSPAGEVTVQSGNSWLDVYKAVDGQVTTVGGQTVRRVIVGGSAHTVGMGGYTQGGGHSPISRKLGLAVDNLLEATIVLADGRKAVVNAQGTTLSEVGSEQTTHTSDTSLFWAIRGGGGGTWGVVTHFTFRLHFAPQRFRRVTVNWALYYKGVDIGSDTVRYVLRKMGQLSEDWGGYLIVSGLPLNQDSVGSLTLFLNHFGNASSPSNDEVTEILNHNTMAQFGKNDTDFATFLEYEKTVYDPPQVYCYVYNTFVQNQTLFNEGKLDQLAAFFMGLKNAPTDKSGSVCTGSLIGGQMARAESGTTPVNPKFRSGLMSMSCALGWPMDPLTRDDFYVQKSMQQRDQLLAFGEGVYFNEPSEDLTDWKTQFWGQASTYDRLLAIKKRWDPANYLWCHNCVGSDLGENYTSLSATTGEGPSCPSSGSERVKGGIVGIGGGGLGGGLVGVVALLSWWRVLFGWW